MRANVLFLCSLLILGPAAVALAVDDPDQIVEQIKALKQAGKLPEAQAMAEKYMKEFPDHSVFPSFVGCSVRIKNMITLTQKKY